MIGRGAGGFGGRWPTPRGRENHVGGPDLHRVCEAVQEMNSLLEEEVMVEEKVEEEVVVEEEVMVGEEKGGGGGCVNLDAKSKRRKWRWRRRRWWCGFGSQF